MGQLLLDKQHTPVSLADALQCRVKLLPGSDAGNEGRTHRYFLMKPGGRRSCTYDIHGLARLTPGPVCGLKAILSLSTVVSTHTSLKPHDERDNCTSGGTLLIL